MRILKKLVTFFLVRTDGTKEFANLNATVLSLMLATLSAYVIYSVGRADGLKTEIFQEAEKINTLRFITSFDSFPDPSLYDTSDPKKRTYLLVRLDSLVTGRVVFDEPWMTPIGFSRDPELRGEEVIRTIRSLSRQYPFPKPSRVQVTPVGTREILYEPIPFDDIEKTAKWADDLAEVTGRIRTVLYGSAGMMGEQINAYNEKLRKRFASNYRLLSADETQRIMHDFDQDSPKVEAQIFFQNILQADNIAAATSLHFNQLKADQARGSAVNKFIRLIFIATCMAFLFGVIVPMVSRNPLRLFVIYLPILFYVFALIVIGRLLFRL